MGASRSSKSSETEIDAADIKSNHNHLIESLKPELSCGAESEVARMFDGRSVFITGASGFIGRVLLEKLLRCYTGIKHAYILMRPNKNKPPLERLHKQVLNVPLFDSIRSMEKEGGYKLIEKIVVVPGDIGEPQLGICKKDMQMMLEDESLSFVFHSAAAIKFEEPLKVSVQLNLIATQMIIEFSRKLKNLAGLCHVSTAYVNGHLPASMKIEERLYPIRQTPQQVIELAKNLDQDLMQVLRANLVADKPNTYTYSKALAEHLLAVEAADLPVAIVRPSVVVAAWKDPFPGWIDNINGPTGLLLAISKGLLRTIHCHRDCRADLIPVDVVVNALIASTFYVVRMNYRRNTIDRRTKVNPAKYHETEEGYLPVKQPPIFHINTGDLRPIYWYESELFSIARDSPSVDTYRYPFGSFKHNKYLDILMRLLVHCLPALILDGMCLVSGKKRRMMQIYGRLHTAIDAVQHFGTHDYKFVTKNIGALQESLNAFDRKQLFMDIENIEWPLFFGSFFLGCRRYLLRESDDTLELARKNSTRAYLVEMSIRTFGVLLLCLCLGAIINYSFVNYALQSI